MIVMSTPPRTDVQETNSVTGGQQNVEKLVLHDLRVYRTVLTLALRKIPYH